MVVFYYAHYPVFFIIIVPEIHHLSNGIFPPCFFNEGFVDQNRLCGIGWKKRRKIPAIYDGNFEKRKVSRINCLIGKTYFGASVYFSNCAPASSIFRSYLYNSLVF